MVFFNCNACGEALKKNQVEKHTNRCRSCEVLSCVDCGKDFWGNDYQSHTKCMTEDEKYCGQSYVPKVNKGEAKQEQWIEKVQGAIEKASSNPGLRNLLVRLKDYPNIPRKQQKFQNFLKNSLRVYNQVLITQVWDTLMAHSAQDTGNKESTDNAAPKQGVNGNCPVAPVAADEAETETEAAEPKKSKREKKEERRNKANKKEKKDRADPSENGEDNRKKSKKRKHRDEDVDEDGPVENGSACVTVVPDGQPQKKKKKKQVLESEENIPEAEENGDPSQLEEERPKKKKKFDWESTITKVLEDKGEISLKKLRKKVLNEFAALDSANYSEENLQAKFDKKVKKMQSVQVLKERAKLKDA